MQNKREVAQEIDNVHGKDESVGNLHERREDADGGASEREGPREQRELTRVSLPEVGPDLGQTTRESETRSDDGNEVLQLEMGERVDTNRLRNEADGNAAEKKQSEVTEKHAPCDVGILGQAASQSPLAIVQVKQNHEDDILQQNQDALSIRAERVMLCITRDEHTNVNHVVNDKGKVLRTLKVERVHIQAEHTPILHDGVDLREFHDCRAEHKQVSHQFAQNVRHRQGTRGWE